MRVAVLGTGIMGAPIARNIAAAGHDVTVWNRSREKAESVGARVAAAPQDAVDGADTVITMLADGEAVLAVMEDVRLAAGQVWWQASTVGLEGIAQARELAGDADLLDGPVSGTRQPAEQGQLVVLVSGPATAKERCAPLFDAVGSRTIDLGEEPGEATRMKLVMNAWLVALVGGLAEAVALAERVGADPRRFLEIIDGGPIGPPYAKLKGTMMVERTYDPAFTLALAAKDARLVREAARARGLDLPLVEAAEAQMRSAIERGYGDSDMAATVEASRAGGAVR